MNTVGRATAIALAGWILATSNALAQLTGDVRLEFVKGSFGACADAAARDHPEIAAAAVRTYCRCMADKEADMTTQADIDYVNAHKAGSDNYKARIHAIAPACRVAAGLDKGEVPGPAGQAVFTKDGEEIPLIRQGNTYLVPVAVNSLPPMGFILDTGSNDVSLPAEIVFTLWRTGTLQSSDFIGNKIYTLADGRKLPSVTFKIRQLQVGQHVLHDVVANLSPLGADPLLGGSFLSRIATWSIDNNRRILILAK